MADSNGMSSIQAASNLASTQLADQVNTAVMRKALDHAKFQGDAAVSLIEAAASVQADAVRADPHKGNLLDVRA